MIIAGGFFYFIDKPGRQTRIDLIQWKYKTNGLIISFLVEEFPKRLLDFYQAVDLL